MKPKKYEVRLIGWTTTVYAFCEKEALILAQAEAIKNCCNYELVSIEEF
ncbi:hypothetical protein [Paenibacillus cremeus]|nr:hypothetical protein [Paenibacillus cremeus]